MPPASAPFLQVRDGPPAGPGGGGKCAVGHESVVRKSPSGWSPYVSLGLNELTHIQMINKISEKYTYRYATRIKEMYNPIQQV